MRKKKQQSVPNSSRDSNRAIIEVMSRAAIQACELNYLRSKNPLHLLTGLVTAQRGGVPIPDWIQGPLSGAIEKVLASKGKLTIDEALELTPKKGQRSRWTDYTQREKNDRLVWLIEERPKLLLSMGLQAPTKVSGPGGSAEQALDLLHEEGDHTYADVESLLQRYKTLKRASRLTRS